MNANNWIYYSTLVPGYIEKYGMEGMRRRNRQLLEMAYKARNEEELCPIVELLADNNRPLAMFIADRWTKSQKTLAADRDEVFQECCYAMIIYIKKALAERLSQSFFQARLYSAMSTHMQNKESIEKRHYIETVPFQEEEHPFEEEKHYLLNEKFLRTLLTERETNVLKCFFGIGCKEHSLEEIGEKFLVTRERARQIKEKALRKLTGKVGSILNNTNLTRDDFYIEEWERKKVLKKEKPKQEAPVNRNVPSIFSDTDNSSLKR